VCGPEVMMRLTARELLALGGPARRIRVSLERKAVPRLRSAASTACTISLPGIRSTAIARPIAAREVRP
jgi:NAD(P)H-flavin reductase